MTETQASYFLSRGYPSHEELTAAGGVFQKGAGTLLMLRPEPNGRPIHT